MRRTFRWSQRTISRPASAFFRRRIALLACALGVAAALILGGAQPGYGVLPANSISYGYDDLGRLTTVIDPNAASPGVAKYRYDAAGNILGIDRLASSAVTVQQFSPASAPTGSSILVYGTKFSATPGSNTVTFTGGAAGTVTAATTTQLTVTVPGGATTGNVTVTSPNGSGTSSTPFTVVAAAQSPSVSGLSATVIDRGSALTVNGSGFSATASDDAVAIAQTRGLVQTASASSLTFNVPTAANSGHVLVGTPNGSTTSSADVFVPPTGYTASQVETTGRMAVGDTNRTFTISDPNKIGLVVFDGTAGQSVFLHVPTTSIFATNTKILDPLGLEIASTTVGPSSGYVDTLKLPTTGTYTILLDPISGSGSMTLSLYDAAPSTGTIQPNGQPQTVSIGTPGQNALRTFTGSAGERVFLQVDSQLSAVVVRELDVNGFEIASATIGPTTGYVDTRTLAAQGTYTIVVDPIGDRTGNVTLTLYDVPADVTGTLTPGPGSQTPTNVSLSIGQNAVYTFTATAQQRVAVKIAPPASGTAIPSGYLKLTDANDNVLPNGSVLFSLPFSSSVGFVDTHALAAGTYKVVVDPVGTGSGSASLNLYDVPADVTGTITPGPASQTPTDFTVTTPGQNVVYSFTASPNQRVSVKMVPPTSGTTLQPGFLKLTDSNGATVNGASTFYSFPFSSSTAFLDTQTLAAGSYNVVVDPTDANVGSARLSLYDVPADLSGSITIGGSPVTASIGTPGQNAAYTFTGSATQHVNLGLSGSTISQGTARIVEQGQQNPVNSLTFFTSPTTLSATLPADDAYRAEIDPVAERTGDVTLTLTQGTFARLKARGAGGAHAHAAAGLAPRRPQAKPAALPRFKPGSPERWIPDSAEPSTWFTGRSESPFEFIPARRALMGTTAVSGRVLRLDGRPLPHVTLRGGGARTTSDRTGRFLLKPVRVGHFVLTVDSRTANRPGARYGVYEIGVDTKRGRTTVLPFTIWSPLLDTKHEVALHYPLKHELVLKNPLIPHLEVRIPAGSLIRDRQGKLIHRIGITPVPLDRSPFPMPGRFPIYFTVQPGAAYVWPHGVEVIYPNKFHAPRGQRVGFFSYDPRGKGWHQYGKGTVTRDGKQIRFDRGTRQYELTSSGICIGCALPGGLFGFTFGFFFGGDPVDLASGNLSLAHTDLIERGTPQIDLSRTYRSQDTTGRAFGVGMAMTYSMALYNPDSHNYDSADLVLGDGSRIHYQRISPGTGYTDAVLEASTTPSTFYKSRITWDGRVWVLTLTDGTVYTFSNGGLLESIRDRFGNETVVFRTNGVLGEITRIQASSGRWLNLTIDPVTGLTSNVSDQSGRSLTYSYTSGRLTQVQDAKGATTQYGYDGSGRLSTVTDGRGDLWFTNHYDANGRVDQQTLNDGLNSTFHFAYTTDGNGKVVQTDVTNPRNFVRRVTFDGTGMPLTDTRAFGTPRQEQTSYEYQAGTKLLLAKTDARGRRTEYGYNSAGKLTTLRELAGTSGQVTTTYGYDPAFQQLTSVSDPLQHGPSYQYNGRGALTAAIDARSKQTTIAPNLDGQPASSTDPLTRQTTYGYFLGDLTRTTDPAGGIRRLFYDPAGRVIRLTDARGGVTKYEYDADDGLTKITDATNTPTSFVRDGDGNVTKVTDGRLHDTTFGYDKLDRLQSRTDPLLKTESYVYDGDGNLTRFTDRKNQITNYQYDELDRRTSATPATGSITYSYDNGDRLTQVIDSAYGTITRGYDERDHLTSETSPEGTVSYTYDAASRRATMTVTGQPQVSYGFDPADNLTSVTRGSTLATLTYNDLEQPATVTLPDGIVETYSYDSALNLTGITYTKNGNTLGDLQYGYDAGGLRTGVGGSYARVTLPTAVSSATYDNANRLTNWGGTTLTYDFNGSLTKEGNKKNFTWNVRNQLASLSGNVAASFVYDPFGRRTSSTVSGAQTRYLYDGETSVQEQNASHSPTANLLLGIGADQRFATIDTSGNVRSYLTDPLGGVLALADGTGTVQTSYTYEPYGKATATGATGTSYQFTGRENDGATVLQYSRARYYDPIKGRFISEDPLGFSGGNTNLYAYVWDSPTNGFDRTGEAGAIAVPWSGGGGAATSAGAAASGLGAAAAGVAAGTAARKLFNAFASAGEGSSTGPGNGDEGENGENGSNGKGDEGQGWPPRTTKSVDKIAQETGYTKKQINDAIHAVKNKASAYLRSGVGRQNPDMQVDPTTGEVYPETPDGGIGDSIGNIFDYLPPH